MAYCLVVQCMAIHLAVRQPVSSIYYYIFTLISDWFDCPNMDGRTVYSLFGNDTTGFVPLTLSEVIDHQKSSSAYNTNRFSFKINQHD